MRTLTDHIVEGDSSNHQLSITVMDGPGAGGANHEYLISHHPGDCRLPVMVRPVKFQNGPIKEFGVNGVTNEALLAIVVDRLRSFQGGSFSCEDNGEAMEHCKLALRHLQNRTRSRIARGVEGTHQK